MSDKDNNFLDLEGDALDEALLAAIDETDEEERLARKKKAEENQARAEQARVTAIEHEKRKAEIENLRKSLPNEGRRYFLMSEEAECFVDKNEAVVTGIMFGTCKTDDEIYIYRNDGKVMGSKVLDIEVYNGQVFEPATEVNQKKAKIKVLVDFEKTGFTAENAIPKFAVLSSVRPPLKDDKGKVSVENPGLSGLMFRYPEFNKDKEYLGRLMDGIANGRFLVPAMKDPNEPEIKGQKKLKIIMVTKKDDPNKRVLPLFTDLQALYLWRKLFEGEEKPSVIVMSFPEVAKFVKKDGFDVVFNPSGPVSVGLPFTAIDAMSNLIAKHAGKNKVNKEVISDGSKVIVGEPKPCEETDKVREALINYCKNNSSIKKAGLLYIMRSGKLSYLVIADAPAGSQKDVFAGILGALKPNLESIKTVDFSLLSEAPFAKDYFSKKPWDYSS